MANEFDVRNIVQDTCEYDRIIEGRQFNELLGDFYDTMSNISQLDEDDSAELRFKAKADAVRYCHSKIHFNYYKKLGIKDYLWTSSCKDRFCPICAKKIANTREYKFNNILTAAAEEYDLFHLTLTLKNCKGSVAPWKETRQHEGLRYLPDNLKSMAKCFQTLMRYLSGRAKIRGVDFSQYGYAGAIRALEITYNSDQIYHPHYHVIIAMKKGVEFPGENYNDFSYDYKTKEVSPFSNFEILIQKTWYLLLNGKKVALRSADPDAETISSLKRGYSCRLRRLEIGNYHEAFKYAIKPEKHDTITFDVWRDLTDALFRMRAIQTYGLFHGLQLEDDNIDEENDTVYDGLIQSMNAIETPEECFECPKDVRENILNRKCIYISRRRIRSVEREYGGDGDELRLMVAAPERLPEFVQLMLQLPDSTLKRDLKYLNG